MTQQTPSNKDQERARKDRLVRRASLSAGLALYLEAFILSFWPLFTAFFGGIAIMLLSLPSIFSEAGWVIFSILFWGTNLYLFIRGIRRLKLPKQHHIFKRVQEDSKLSYRPLEVLSDAQHYTKPKTEKYGSTPYEDSRALWVRAARTSEEDSKKLRVSWPHPLLATLDRRGLRVMALLGFIGGLIIAGPQSYERVYHGLFPFGGLGNTDHIGIALWIEPPEYTEMSDIVLDAAELKAARNQDASQQDSFIQIPEGSHIQISLTNLWGPSWMRIGNIKVPLNEIDENNKGATLILPELPDEKGVLSVHNLLQRFVSLPFQYINDSAPEINWQAHTQEEKPAFLPTRKEQEQLDKDKEEDKAEEENEDKAEKEEINPFAPPAPKKDKKASTKPKKDAVPYGMNFPLIMSDDYGIKLIKLEGKLPADIQDTPKYGDMIAIEKSVATLPKQLIKTYSFFDLSHHPWAGLPVEITIKATDEAGQATSTPMRVFTLPERQFSHILAAKLVALRKKLIWNGLDAAKDVSFDLFFQLKYPEDMRNDPSIWLGIKTASERLMKAYEANSENEDLSDVINLLWTMALELEDLGISNAANALQDATDAISRALRRKNTSPERMQDLFNDYRNSLTHYLEKLRQLHENRNIGEIDDIPPEVVQDLLAPEALREMLKQMEDLNKTGDYRSLEDMIARMQSLLESFALGGGMPPDLEAIAKGMNVMQGLIDQQKSLLSDTEGLADLMPEDTKKLPEKGFGTLLEFDNDVTRSWNDGDMPPPPGNVLNRNLQKQAPEDEEFNDPDGIITGVPFFNSPLPAQEEEKQAESETQDVESYDDSLPETKEQAGIQEVLRFVLGEVMGEYFEMSDELLPNMPMAELEMRNSTRTLGKNRPDHSIPIQEEVIRLLEEAMEQMQQKMREGMSQRSGMNFSPQQTDPLGRPQSPDQDGQYFSEDSDVEVPESFAKKRIDEILEYLRKHSGDSQRPKIEREYFERLLRQFD